MTAVLMREDLDIFGRLYKDTWRKDGYKLKRDDSGKGKKKSLLTP